MALKSAVAAAGAALLALTSIGGTLAYFEESLPTSLNPLYASSMVDFRAQDLVFDRLWFHDAITNELKSRVVEKWELAENGKAIKITLKQGIRWHNGEAMSAKDICFTVDALLNPGTTSPIAEGYREVLAGCEAQGNQVALVRFTRVFHNPRERLGFAVLPAKEFPSAAITPEPGGNGPLQGLPRPPRCDL
jgi:peptide/nickel transport system substrate-binding protein